MLPARSSTWSRKVVKTPCSASLALRICLPAASHHGGSAPLLKRRADWSSKPPAARMRRSSSCRALSMRWKSVWLSPIALSSRCSPSTASRTASRAPASQCTVPRIECPADRCSTAFAGRLCASSNTYKASAGAGSAPCPPSSSVASTRSWLAITRSACRMRLRAAWYGQRAKWGHVPPAQSWRSVVVRSHRLLPTGSGSASRSPLQRPACKASASSRSRLAVVGPVSAAAPPSSSVRSPCPAPCASVWSLAGQA